MRQTVTVVENPMCTANDPMSTVHQMSQTREQTLTRHEAAPPGASSAAIHKLKPNTFVMHHTSIMQNMRRKQHCFNQFKIRP